jgi:hypothetical protein
VIRGFVGVVPNGSVETGRFYLAPGHDGFALFQCIQTDEPYEDTFRQKALYFTTAGKPNLGLHDLPGHSPLAALDEVQVRVDPTSIAESAFSSHLKAGLFLVNGDAPIICAPDGFRGWTALNILTGRTVGRSFGHEWLSFTRWSLVMDNEAGEELTIASFGQAVPASE